MSWNLPPEALLDDAYTPSLWAVQKVALIVLLGTVIGTVTIADILHASPKAHRSLANAPRRLKPHVSYPVRNLF